MISHGAMRRQVMLRPAGPFARSRAANRGRLAQTQNTPLLAAGRAIIGGARDATRNAIRRASPRGPDGSSAAPRAARLIPGVAATSSTDASRMRRTLPKRLRSAFLRPDPIPGTSSSSDRERSLAADLAVIRDREAMRLIPDALDQVEALARRAAGRSDRGSAGNVELLEALGETAERDVGRGPGRSCTPTAAESWPFPPSTITRSGSAQPPRGPLADAPPSAPGLVELVLGGLVRTDRRQRERARLRPQASRAAEPAAEDLGHHPEVVGRLAGADPEAAVLARLRAGR